MEFALVSPVLLAMLIGAVEAGLLMFSAASANFAAAEAARAASERGDQIDADTVALSKIQATVVGDTAILKVNEIDIFKVTPAGNGTYTPVSDVQVCGGQCINRYTADGAPISIAWLPAVRSVSNTGSDYLAVTINCQYNWLTGFFASLGPVVLSPTYYVRLEPQDY